MHQQVKNYMCLFHMPESDWSCSKEIAHNYITTNTWPTAKILCPLKSVVTYYFMFSRIKTIGVLKWVEKLGVNLQDIYLGRFEVCNETMSCMFKAKTCFS